MHRIFTSEDQLAFAKLSGDFNPLHMDPILARRLMFGGQAVHGLHALLWSLDSHLKTTTQPLELEMVKANFQAGIGVDQAVHCVVTSQDENRVAIQLRTESSIAAWLEIGWRPSQRQRIDTLPQMLVKHGKCHERSIEEVATASGNLPLFFNADLAGRLFPNLIPVLPSTQLATLLATTRLIGMECPGYHSVYSSLNLAFSADSVRDPKLKYHVTECNPRLALVSMEVEAPGATGQVKAFLRPQPQIQAGFEEISLQVNPGEFSSQDALIIGGSRGLGEVTAKILAAGGAEVILTYYRGAQDAQRVVKEIESHGGKADCFELNVLELNQEVPNRIAKSSKPLFLYYFATPHIFGGAKGTFSIQRFDVFSAHYVTGFHRVVKAVLDATTSLQKVFYPSSVAIEELPLDMGEYVVAKSSGEILCDFLQKAHSGLFIFKPRLPRVATDQTVSLLPVNNREPVAILLENLRYFMEN
jgi:hypothetical protein